MDGVAQGVVMGDCAAPTAETGVVGPVKGCVGEEGDMVTTTDG
jgi:hypothetical protein